MRAIKISLLALFVALQFALWFGDKNLIDLYQLKRAIAHTQSKNTELRHQNDKLIAEVIDLKQGGVTLETLARQRYGLIKQNETFYQIIE